MSHIKQLSEIHQIEPSEVQKNVDKYYSPPIDRNVITA